ncbi:MAG: potassium-transporting ATPase subunit KdpA [Acetobacteraceae bacterium]|uniref:potassium-transporting ATPase subunit KdpA n=1 Tax=Bradyrhizobium sp. TaxID=376 RepID=UPI003D0B287D
MTTQSWLLLAFYLVVLLAAVKPLGLYMTRLMEAPRWQPIARLENGVFRVCGVGSEEMSWRRYALAVLVFSLIGFTVVYALQRLQLWLPLNPQQMPNVTPDSSFNTAISFVTNTNWQGYGGEATMSYLTQMLGLGVENFVSAAAGIAVVFALIRGFARHSAQTIGNFWADLYRVTTYLLLPLSFILALVLVSQGVIQNFSAYQEVTTLEPTTYEISNTDDSGQTVTETVTTTAQTLPMGPAASQIAIKQLGTNGGGFFNVNSAHPYENPNVLTNFLEVLAILLIPAALCFTFGKAVGDTRQGWAVLAAMTVIFTVATVATTSFEQQGNPRLAALGADIAASDMQSGGNMEGKETRNGIGASALWATATTSASNGSVNSMHDSYTPLGGLVPMLMMQLGEVVFGGVGSGLYGMLVFALMAVFVAGLMIGRTPEYLGKKIEAFDMKMVSIAILMTPALVLIGTAIAVMADAGRATIYNPGAHGFSEVLYAFSSAANNNGSAFAGLGANTPFYNGWLGVAMWFGRFAVIVPVLAIAGSLAAKKRLAHGPGTMPTHGLLFVGLLIGTVLMVGALTYVPALALGPAVEHLILWTGN